MGNRVSCPTIPSERVAWVLALNVLRAIKTVDGAHIDRKFTEREMGKIIVHRSNDKDWLAWRSALTALYTIPIKNPPLSSGK